VPETSLLVVIGLWVGLVAKQIVLFWCVGFAESKNGPMHV